MSGHTVNIAFYQVDTDELTRDRLRTLMELVNADTAVSQYDHDTWCITVHLYDTKSASEAVLRALGLVYKSVEAHGFECCGVKIVSHDAPIYLSGHPQ